MKIFDEISEKFAGKKILAAIHLDAIINGQRIEAERPVLNIECSLENFSRALSELTSKARSSFGSNLIWKPEGSPKNGNYVGGKVIQKVGKHFDNFNRFDQKHLDENSEVEFEVTLVLRVHNRSPDVDLLELLTAA